MYASTVRVSHVVVKLRKTVVVYQVESKHSQVTNSLTKTSSTKILPSHQWKCYLVSRHGTAAEPRHSPGAQEYW